MDQLVNDAIQEESTENMFEKNDTRLRILYLYQLLLTQSDEEHPLSTKQIDAAITSAIVDRLTYKAYLIDMEGDSYRLRETLRHNGIDFETVVK